MSEESRELLNKLFDAIYGYLTPRQQPFEHAIKLGVEELLKFTPSQYWRVVAEEPAADPNEAVWTVSLDNDTGWETDCGYDGYGLTKAQAEELAFGANLIRILRDLRS